MLAQVLCCILDLRLELRTKNFQFPEENQRINTKQCTRGLLCAASLRFRLLENIICCSAVWLVYHEGAMFEQS